MAEFNFSELATIGQLDNVDVPSPTEQKAQMVEMSTLMKQAIFGSREEQRQIASNVIVDSELSRSQELVDMRTLEPIAFAAKYGVEAEQNRYRFAQADRELREDKNRGRTGTQIAGDLSLGVAQGTTNLLGGAGAAVAGAIDGYDALRHQILGTEDKTQLAPYVSEATGFLTNALQGAKSTVAQEGESQQGIEAEILQGDNARERAATVAGMSEDAGFFERTFVPGATNIIEDFKDVGANAATNPQAMTNLAANAVGSLLPISLAARGIGAARATAELTSRGMTPAAAKTFLSTPAGRKMMTESAESAVPVLATLSEGGAGINQAQQAIMGMSEAELGESSDYVALRDSGDSHEDAQRALASQAGTTAGLLSMPGAFLAGNLSKSFTVNPLGGASRGLGSVAGNVVGETVEETLQEANTQLASNLGQNIGAGLDIDPIEGVGGNAALGALGGAMTSGAMQTPAAAGAVALAAAGGVSAAATARMDSLEKKADETSVTGSVAQETAATNISAAASAVVSNLTTPEQSAEAQVVGERVKSASLLSPDEEVAFAEKFPTLAEKKATNPDVPLSRLDVVNQFAAVLDDKNETQEQRQIAAFSFMELREEMSAVDSDDVRAEINKLNSSDPLNVQTKEEFARLEEQIKTVNSSPAIAKAEAEIRGYTPETVAGIIDLDLIKNKDASIEDRLEEAGRLELIARINPDAVGAELIGLVLNQVGGGKQAEGLKKKLQLAKTVAEEFQRADTLKAELVADQAKAIENLTPEQKKTARARPHGTYDIVRDEVNLTGNKTNNLPSLLQHRRRVSDAASSGHVERAQDALTELSSFAESQVNKLKALAASKAEGGGSKSKKGYRAYNGSGFFDQKGVWVDEANPRSIAQAREVEVDANTAVALVEALAEAYGLTLPTKLVAEKLGLTGNQTTPTPTNPESETATTQEAQPVVEEDVDVIEEIDTTEETIREPEVQQEREIEEAVEARGVPVDAEVAQDAAEIEADLEVGTGSTQEPDIQGGTRESGESVVSSVGEDSVSADGADVDRASLEEFVEEPAAPVEGTWFENLKAKLNMKSAEGRNVLANAFRHKEGKSTLGKYEGSQEALAEAIRSGEIRVEALDRELTIDEQAALISIANGAGEFTGLLNKAMNVLIDSKGWGDELRGGKIAKILGYRNALPLNAITTDTGTSFELDPMVAQAAYMAAMDWIVGQAKRGLPRIDDEYVSKMFGMGRNGQVTAEMRTFATTGIPLQTAIEDMAKTMEDLLGIEADPTAEITETQGLFRAMASSALEVLIDNGSLSQNSIRFSTTDIGGKAAPKTMISLSMSEDVQKDADFAKVQSLTKPFTATLTAGFDNVMYVGTAPKQINPNQIKNRLAPISKKAARVINKLQNTPAFINGGLVDLIEALGDAEYLNILGYVDVTDDVRAVTNKEDLSSIEGKNISLQQGLSGVAEYSQAADKTAQATGGTFSSVPIYFAWRLSSVNRLQQQGAVTPQGDKIAREAISQTRSTLDLRNETHVKGLWLAIAQSLDISVEKSKHSAVIGEAQDMVTTGGALFDAVVVLENWLETGELRQGDLAAAIAKGGVEPTAKLVHALMTVAELNQEQGSEFITHLALEADGKTDGPVNAMVNMATGLFTAMDVVRFAKGGLFFTDQPTSLSDYIEQEVGVTGNEDNRAQDLYHLAAADLEDSLTSDPAELEKNMSLMRVFDAFLPDFELTGIEGDPIRIKRGLVKNPLTVFLYGSGEKGIADKLTNAIVKEIYKTMSEIAKGKADGSLPKGWMSHPTFQKNQDLMADLAALFGDIEDVRELQKVFADPVNASMNAASFLTASTRIQENFAEPMMQSVNRATGGLRTNMQLIQGAASIQTLIFKELFRQNQEGMLTGEAGTIPSEVDLEESFIEMMGFAPIYESPDASFHIAKPERDRLDKVASESFSGKLAAKLTGVQPADASVKVSPYMTIGLGDGQMMLNIYDQIEADMTATLAVFDGVEMAIDRIEDQAPAINKAVWDAWMQSNMYQGVSEGFTAMLTRLTPEMWNSLSADTKKEIGRAMGLEKGKLPAYADLQSVVDVLNQKAKEQAARKKAMSEMAAQVDHMAGAEKPHSTEGRTIAGASPLDAAAIAAELNKTVEAEMAKEETQEDGYLDPVDPVFTEALNEIGEPVSGSHPGVRRVSGKTLTKALGKMKTSLSGSKRKILGEFFWKDPAIAGTQYYFGTEAELNAFRADAYPDLGNDPIKAGVTYLGEGIAFVTNQTPETFLHEMMHTKTASVVSEFYKDPENAPEQVTLGMNNLTGLMAEVRGMNAVNAGLATLQEVLNDYEGQPTEQMLEFVAYILTNQGLSDWSAGMTSYQRFSRVVKQSLAALKRILGLSNSDVPTKDIFDQVRFNTKVILMDAAETTSSADLVMNQSGNQSEAAKRVWHINQRYQRRGRQFLEARRKAIKTGANESTAAQREQIKRDTAKLLLDGRKGAERAVAAGFKMSVAQQRAFRSVHSFMSSAVELNPALLRQLHALHDEVLSKITPEIMVNAGAIDEDTAKAQIAYLQSGRDTELMVKFLALSESSPLFREALAGMEVTPSAKFEYSSFDTAIESAGSFAMSALARLSFKDIGRQGSAGRILDALSQGISALDSETRLDKASGALSKQIDKANAAVAGYVDTKSTQASRFTRGRANATDNKTKKLAFNTMSFIAAMGSKTESEARGDTMTTFLNSIEGWNTVRATLHDLRGGNTSNMNLLRLINPVKAKIDALRQDFRENTPETLAKAFSRKLEGKEWAGIHKAIGTTGLSILGLVESKALLANPATVDQRIADTLEGLQGLAPNFVSRYADKAKALARFRVTDELTSTHLLRNAYAIAHLGGEKGRPDPATVSQATIDQVDRLVALYAYQMTDAASKKAMADLMAKESAGMDAVIGLTASVRALELEKTLSADPEKRAIATHNALHGYVPNATQPNSKVVVEFDSNQQELEMQGWVRIGDYNGSRDEDVRERRGYYQSTTAGKATFKQGIAQTVHTTYSGVSVLTGALSSDTVAGTLKGVRAGRIGERMARAQPGSLDNLAPGEYMMPIFDQDWNVVGYDRHMDPAKTRGLQKDTHMGRMLGVWAGRLLEEEAAHEFNEVLVDGVMENYKEGLAKGRGAEYVNIADPKIKDKIYKDAWATMGAGIKEYAEEIFESPDTFYVRKDLIEDVVGYRAPSITDVWTGQSRLDPKAQKVVKDLVTLIGGKRAYPWLKKGEMFAQDAVGVAKTTIIVRSAVVGTANIVSNVLHLTLRGVPVNTIATSGREKILEIQEYVRNKEKISELQISYAARIEDTDAGNKIKARIASLEVANKRMSIAPLIEAGEFSTISEDLTEADVAVREGRLMDYIEKAVDRLPESAGTVARNIAITKDTAIFKGLNRMVQYGDFVAKAVLYDHLIAQGKDQREVLDIIMEEFVQYNRLPGRGRDYLESMGMVWFMNYALRIMKVSANMMRERPLSSLVMMGQVGPAAGVDSVMSGSLFGKYMDDSLPFSFGPEMGLNSPQLHPFHAITDNLLPW